MNEIENKVANSKLVNLDITEFYPKGQRLAMDLKDLLYEGLILKEKTLREYLKNLNYSEFKGTYVYVFCSSDAILPLWAYFLITSALNDYCHWVCYGNLDDLNNGLMCAEMQKHDFSIYQNKAVLVRGCSNIAIPNNVYMQLVRHLKPFVQSLMFGEACSNVPIYKKNSIKK